MENKAEIKEELEKLAPVLSKMNKPSLPDVPELYFEGFSTRLMRKLEEERDSEVTHPQTEGFLHKFKQWFLMPGFSIAFGVMVLLAGIWFFYSKDTSNTQIAVINIQEQDAYYYISENIEQFDAQTLAENSLDDNSANQIMEELIDQKEILNDLDNNIESINIEDLL